MNQATKQLEGHSARILSVKFSPDGSKILTASRDKTLKLWDAQTFQEIVTLNGHTSNVFGCDFSSDSQTIASASRDKTVILWNLQGNALKKFTYVPLPVSKQVSPLTSP